MHKHIFPRIPLALFLLHSNGEEGRLWAWPSSTLTIVIHLYTTASLRIGTDSPRCTCHFFLAFLISYKCLILKKQKERKKHCLPDRYVPWPTNSKGTGKGSGFHTGEELLSRLQGRLGRAWKSADTTCWSLGKGTRKKTIPRKEDWPPPEPGLEKGEMSWEVSVSWHLLVAEEEGESMRKGWEGGEVGEVVRRGEGGWGGGEEKQFYLLIWNRKGKNTRWGDNIQETKHMQALRTSNVCISVFEEYLKHLKLKW